MTKRLPLLPVALIMGAMVLAIAILAYLTFAPSDASVRQTVDPPPVITQIQRLAELVTVKYSVQKVVGLEEQKIPFGSERVLLIVQARVLGGVDLTRLSAPDVIVDDSGVRIRLPDPQILHVYLEEKETRVWDREVTWWTPWVPYNPQLESSARLAAIESVKEAALEMGLLQEAERNAQLAIRGLLHATGAKTVVFLSTS
jgi:hypothetical protein